MPVSVLKRSPLTPEMPPRKTGRKAKKETEEASVEGSREELVELGKLPVPELPRDKGVDDEDDSGAEDKSDLSR